MEIENDQIHLFTKQIKDFWNIIDFKKEILDWRFKLNETPRTMYVIGHPTNSHKGTSVGDILPYTRLPEVLKENYPECKVKVPEWFWFLFSHNPYVDGICNDVNRWGSLGTWGTTVQRTCNVWGVHTFKFTPIIYRDYDKPYRGKILICINSKTGGRIKNIQKFEDIIEKLNENYYCVQLLMKDEARLKTVHKYIYNLHKHRLVDVVGSFEFYLGAQNSIYHLSKALELNVIGILPENVDPFFVKLPLLTQINHLEIEMLSEEERQRSIIWKKKRYDMGKNPDDSHHVGWLYPDSTHLTMDFENETVFCPKATPENVFEALHGKIYPFRDSRLWDVNKYKYYWINDG